jgi:hypothetical protein
MEAGFVILSEGLTASLFVSDTKILPGACPIEE